MQRRGLFRSVKNGSVPENPFAYYSFDEGSGTTAADSSGNNRDIIANYSPIWGTGYKNGCLSGVRNSGQYFELNSTDTHNLMNNGDGYSIAFWAYFTTNGETPIGRGSASAAGSRTLRLKFEGNTEHRIVIGDSAGNWVYTSYSTGVSYPLDKWFHFTVAIGHTQYKIYHDGVLVWTSGTYNTGGGFKDTGISLKIGNAEGEESDGKIDEIYLYDRILTDEEVLLLSRV